MIYATGVYVGGRPQGRKAYEDMNDIAIELFWQLLEGGAIKLREHKGDVQVLVSVDEDFGGPSLTFDDFKGKQWRPRDILPLASSD